MRKHCSSDRKIFLKFEDDGQEFAKILRSLEQFLRTVNRSNTLEQLESKLEKIIWI